MEASFSPPRTARLRHSTVAASTSAHPAVISAFFRHKRGGFIARRSIWLWAQRGQKEASSGRSVPQFLHCLLNSALSLKCFHQIKRTFVSLFRVHHGAFLHNAAQAAACQFS